MKKIKIIQMLLCGFIYAGRLNVTIQDLSSMKAIPLDFLGFTQAASNLVRGYPFRVQSEANVLEALNRGQQTLGMDFAGVIGMKIDNNGNEQYALFSGTEQEPEIVRLKLSGDRIDYTHEPIRQNS